jgi:energy-coupling factor transporter ATP-binding protein EcfA2
LPSPDDQLHWILDTLYAGDNPVTHPARESYLPGGTWEEQINQLERNKLIRRKGLTLVLTKKGHDAAEKHRFYAVPPTVLPFRVLVGPIASGNVVVKDGITWDKLRLWGVRSVLGLEMEAASIGSIARKLEVPYWLVAKGVMDYADPRKDDRFKPFAARASAEVLVRFLKNRIHDVLSDRLQAKRSNHFMNTYDLDDGLRRLQGFSTAEFQNQIALPLLTSLGYRSVRHISTSQEEGRDLLAVMDDEFGEPQLVAIYINRLNVTNASRESNVEALVNHINSLLARPSAENELLDKQLADYAIFVTPDDIGINASEEVLRKVRELGGRAKVIQGRQILSLMATHLPRLLSRIGSEAAFRLRADRILNEVNEAGVAFQLSRKLLLDNIYVDATIDEGDRRLVKVAWATLPENIELTVSQAKELITFQSQESGTPNQGLVAATEAAQRNAETRGRQLIASTPTAESSPRPALDEEIERTRTEVRFNFYNFRRMFEPTQRMFRSYLSKLEKLDSATFSPEAATELVKLSPSLRVQAERMEKVAVLRDRIFDAPINSELRAGIPASALPKLQVNTYVIGKPGSGKTTLLRRLAQLCARSASAEIPLFIPLFEVRDTTYAGLVRACEKASSNVGEATTLHAGTSYVRLFLDGLDELGERAEPMLGAIHEYAERHPSCRIMLSCRDVIEDRLRWKDALTVRLLPFSDLQQQDFVSKWFSSHPESREALNEWLKRNERMREAGRTPLILALLCSLFESQASMPRTEIELYDGRFDLLLGRWERAKGLPPLSSELREHYERFLMALGFYLHQVERRRVHWTVALKIAERFRFRFAHLEGERLLRDCLRRGVLEQEAGDEISFGDHLTYQEFMAARWLTTYNRSDFIWSHFHAPWWRKVIDFYAAMVGDLRDLIAEALRFRFEIWSFRQLVELLPMAPLTGAGAIDKLKVEREYCPLFDWTRPGARIDVLE